MVECLHLSPNPLCHRPSKAVLTAAAKDDIAPLVQGFQEQICVLGQEVGIFRVVRVNTVCPYLDNTGALIA